MSKWVNEDTSRILPEEVKTEDQGKGIYYAALGKEIDEHNILKRRENKGSFNNNSYIFRFYNFRSLYDFCSFTSDRLHF